MIGGSPSPLIKRIVDNPQLLARYRHWADTILETYFHPEVLLPKVNQLYAQIKADLATDPFPSRRVTNPQDQGYDSIVGSIKDFIRLRYQTARRQLDHSGPRPPILPVRRPGHQQPEPQPGPPSAGAPSDLRLVSVSRSAVSLQWTDNATDEGAYIVQRADGKAQRSFRNHIGQPGADITTALDSQVIPGSIYLYRVYAVRPSPLGPQGTGVSNVITVRIPDQDRGRN